MIRHLHIREFVPTGKYFHLAAPAHISQSKPESLHNHDFHEIFYVDRGMGSHWINGTKLPLAPGTLWLIRDTDSHALTAEGEHVQLVNIAFGRQSWTSTLRRYFPADPDPMRLPFEARTRAMSIEEHQHLHQICRRMIPADRSRAHLEHFLIEVLWLWFRIPATPSDESPAPDWLISAVCNLTGPENLQGGTRALADLAGRTPDHVARASKKWLGKSPTAIVNEARMEFAARQLSQTDRAILDIAYDCGLANLAHFYKLFASQYGCTPRRYRLQQVRIIGHTSAGPGTRE
jgi:AraC family cel operon transcriptional repressor